MNGHSVHCEALMTTLDGTFTVHIDVRFAGMPEVWLSVASDASGGGPRGSAVWQTGRWVVLAGPAAFAPETVLRRVLEQMSWTEETAPACRDDILRVLRAVARMPT